MEEPSKNILSQEDRKRLDRQRFIGLQTQKKLLKTKVLICPANGSMTQLAKNLILAGVNVTIYDQHIITQLDFESNFLIGLNDIGKERGQVVFNRLKQMNPSGQNNYHTVDLINNPDIMNQEFYQQFTILATSTPSFEVMQKWYNMSYKTNLIYYNIVTCGLHSFALISLGKQYNYSQLNYDKTVKNKWSIQTIPFSDCFDLNNIKKNKQSIFLASLCMMQKAEQLNLKYNPFLKISNQQVLQQILQIGKEIYPLNQKQHKQFLSHIAKLYGIDYCPAYSVISSIVSQQIIKIAQNQFQPAINWLFFNSEQGYASVFKIEKQIQLFKKN